MAAVLSGNHEMLRFLLDKGGSPDIPDYEGRTPLMAASEKSDPEAVALLIVLEQMLMPGTVWVDRPWILFLTQGGEMTWRLSGNALISSLMPARSCCMESEHAPVPILIIRS